MAAPYRGDQGGIALLRSSSFSATGGDVSGGGTFGDQAGVLPCAGYLLEGGQVVGSVPPSGTQDCGGVLLLVAGASVLIATCTLPQFPQKREFSGRSAPQ
jgi:hypothetical protein